MKPGDQYYTEEDGDNIASFRDLDCSVSGISPCVTNYTTILRPYTFYQTANCENRLNWNMMICEEEFGQVYICTGIFTLFLFYLKLIYSLIELTVCIWQPLCYEGI